MVTNSPGARRGRLRSCLSGLALLLVSCCVTLGVAEVLFRAFFLQPKVPDSPEAFQRLIASAWPHPIAEQKPPGTIRILSLCDSFGEAGGHENYCYLVGQALRDQGLPVEVVNLSVGEYDLPEELAILQRYGARYHPDLVLHGLFVGNDFYLTGDGLLMTYQRISIRHRNVLRHPVPRSFMLLVWGRHYLRGLLATLRSPRAGATDEGAGGSFAEADYLRIERDRLVHCQKSPPPDERWAGVAELLAQIRAETERMGAKYAMVIHPDQYQVETKLRSDVLATFGLNPSGYDWELPQRWLTGQCAAVGVPAIDLLPRLREQGAAGGLYRVRDSHYNQAGNRAAAAGILSALEAHPSLLGQATLTRSEDDGTDEPVR